MSPFGQRPIGSRFDVLALGESMLTLYREPGAADVFAWDVCGAESNTARYCAALGLETGWISRLGVGMAGTLVHDAVAASGVDTSLVEFCDRAPTGLMLRDSPERGQRVEYYRRGSAASEMSPEATPVQLCLNARVLHLTGITPGLSEGCRRLIETLLSAPADTLRSFDLNWRPPLWPDGPPSQLLQNLANRAGIVFVGLDEAAAVWGLTEPQAVRDALTEPEIVVVKDASNGAHAFAGATPYFEPALRGPIVGLRGAGDAFAAGFLAGYLTHPGDLRRCLRLGHVVAMSAMTSELDVGPLPERVDIDAMLDLSAGEWQSLIYPHPPEASAADG